MDIKQINYAIFIILIDLFITLFYIACRNIIIYKNEYDWTRWFVQVQVGGKKLYFWGRFCTFLDNFY